MKKVFALFLIFLFALGLAAGYLLLTDKIVAGRQKIVDGQRQLAEGEQMLAQGKTKLATGEQKLSEVKEVYHKSKSFPLLWAATALPIAGQIVAVASNEVAKDKIATGNQQVVRGKEKIKAGEKQLAEGKQELRQGISRLTLANQMRIACAIGAIFFSVLLIALGFYWRRSLFH